MEEFHSGNVELVRLAKEKVDALQKEHVVKHFHGINCENVTGDYLYTCKNVFDSYDAKNCENCRYQRRLDRKKVKKQ